LSTGFLVSVGCPVTSPGFEVAVPVALPVSGVVVLGAAGRCTLPLLVSVAPVLGDVDPLTLPLALPEVDGAATLPLFEVDVLVSPLDDGCVMLLLDDDELPRSDELFELLDLCIALESLDSLRPCDFALWCFLCFAPVAVVSAMPLTEPFESELGLALSPAAPVVEVPVADESDGEFTALEFVDVLGNALLVPVLPLSEFVTPAVPLSSPVEFVLLAGLFALLLVSVVVCARAPNADRASASAALRMIFTSPPWLVRRR
jgi:hypothetical protein